MKAFSRISSSKLCHNLDGSRFYEFFHNALPNVAYFDKEPICYYFRLYSLMHFHANFGLDRKQIKD